MIVDFPHWATRELLMNAICHRDYESNGPVQFYQYDDRIEIMNPGGLYGKVTPDIFPVVNDYRNGFVAEGMKVLGFVNRYRRGVQAVQDELRSNGNGEADFKLHLGTAFLVVENIANKDSNKDSNKETNKETNKEKQIKIQIEIICRMIQDNPNCTYKDLMKSLGVGYSTVYERVKMLKQKGIIRREGSLYNGKWIIDKNIYLHF